MTFASGVVLLANKVDLVSLNIGDSRSNVNKEKENEGSVN